MPIFTCLSELCTSENKNTIDPTDIRQRAWLIARDRDFRSTLDGRAAAAIL